MAGKKDVSFTVSATETATAVLKTVENAVSSLFGKLLSLPSIIGAALAGAGFGDLFKGAVEAAADAETALSRLQTAIGNVGGDFATVKPQVDAVIASLGKTTTFKDTELVAGLEQLIVVSGNVTGSLGAMGLVTDIARQRHIDLATAATLVGRVMDGNTSMLKRYGIVLTDGVDAMTQLQAKFGGFAAGEATTFNGALERIGQAWERFQISLGAAIIGTDAGREATSSLAAGFADLETWVSANQDKIGQLTLAVVGAAQAIGGAFVSAIKSAGPFLTWLTGQINEAVPQWERFLPLIEKYGLIIGTGKYLAGAGPAAPPTFHSPEYYGGTSTPNGTGPFTDMPPLPSAGQSPQQLKALEALQTAFDKLNATTDSAKPKWQTFQDAIDKWTASAEKAHLPAAELQADTEKLNAVLQQLKDDAAAKAFGDLWIKVQEQTGDATDKLLGQLDKEIEGFKKQAAAIADPAMRQGFLDLIDHYEQLRDKSIAFHATLDQATAGLVALSEQIKEHDGDMVALSADIDTAGAAVDEWTAKTQDATLSAADHTAALAELAKAQVVLTAAVTDYGKAAALVTLDEKNELSLVQQHYRDITQTAQAYGQLADSVLSAGQAMSVFSQSTAATLHNVVQLAVGVANLFAALGASSSEPGGSGGSGGGGTVIAGAGVGSVFGPIGAIIGAIGGLVATLSAGDPAAKNFSAANTAALNKLTETLLTTGREGVALSGTQLAQATALAAAIQQQNTVSFSGKTYQGGIIAENLTATQLNLLNDAAAALGIKLNGSAGALQSLITALGLASSSVQLFGSDVASQESLGTFEAHIEGLAGGAAVQATLGAAIAASPALAAIFGGKSVGSFLDAGGGNSVVAALLALTKQVGDGGVTNAMLGGLTASQFTDTITKLFDAVTKLPGVSAPGSLASSVTVASTGSLAAASYAQVDTTNSLLLDIRGVAFYVRDWLKGVPGAGAGAGSGPLTLTIGQIGPNYIDGTAADPGAGGAIGAAAIASIDAGLAKVRVNLRAAVGAPMGR